MNIAIYARVSSETQAKDGTIDSQIEALREYAKKNQLSIVQEFLDDGYSGTELMRPGLDRLRDSIQEGLFEAVLILSPDRLSRKQAHQYILMEEFKKRNIQVLFTTQKFGDSPEDQLMLQIQGAVSEYERAKIMDRMRRGRKHSVVKGQVLGNKAPYGYRFVRKSESAPAHWEINPEEAKIVKMIFYLYVNKGLKGAEIAQHLREEGIPTRSTTNFWWNTVIYSILQNETYTGTAYMFKTQQAEPAKSPKLKKYRSRKNSSKQDRPREDWIGIPVTSIIDLKLWQRAQEVRKQNAYKSHRNNIKNDYLLRGLVICGLCGSIASGHVSNKNTYYSCGAKRNKNILSKPHEENISKLHQFLDKNVWEGLVELLSDPNNLSEQLGKRLEAKKRTLTATSESLSDKTNNDLAKLDVQEQRLIDAYRVGAINLPELKEQKVKIASKRQVVQRKKKTVPSQLESSGRPEITLDDLGDVSARFSRAMARADFTKREKLVNLLVNSVTLYPNKALVEGNIPVIQGDVLSTASQWLPLLFQHLFISSAARPEPTSPPTNRQSNCSQT